MNIQDVKSTTLELLAKVCQLEIELKRQKTILNLGYADGDLTIKEFADKYGIKNKKCFKALRDLGYLNSINMPVQGWEDIFRVILVDGKQTENGHYLLNAKVLINKDLADNLASVVRKQVSNV